MERGELRLGDEDRLPWLEPAAATAPRQGESSRATLGWVLAGGGLLLLLAALLAGGLWWMRGSGTTDGGGALIAAPEGPYKIAAPEPGGMEVEGQGDTSFAASDGIAISGSIDLAQQSETPMLGRGAAQAAAEAATPTRGGGEAGASAEIPATGGRLVARPGGTAPAARGAGGGGGTLVQLGSFNSEARAREAWRILTGRFGWLGERTPAVATGEVAGRSVYRLRLDAGSAGEARDLCRRLRVGGEACLVVGG